MAGGSPQAGCELGGPSAGKSPPRRPEAPQGRSRGPPRKSRGAPKKNSTRAPGNCSRIWAGNQIFPPVTSFLFDLCMVSPKTRFRLGNKSPPQEPKNRPRGAPRRPQGTSRGPPPNLGEPRKKTAHAHQETAAGFGPEIQFSHLSLAFSLILSGVPQNEVSFGKNVNSGRFGGDP